MIHVRKFGRRATAAAVLGAGAVAAAAIAGGCNVFGLTLYAIMAEQNKTQPAEYDLKPAAERAEAMVIRVWADSDITQSHDRAPLHLAQTIRETFRRKDPETKKESPLGKLKIRDPREVDRWLQSRPDGGDSVSARELSDRFNAKIVLDVSLEQYTIKTPDSDELFQGRIVAVVNVYDFTKGEESQLPVGKRRISVVFPDHPGDIQGSEDSEYQIFNITRQMFADRLFKKLHAHEVPMKEDLKETYRNRD